MKETTPLRFSENHFVRTGVIESTEEHDTRELIADFKQEKKSKKSKGSNPNLNCTLPSMLVFILLGAIWGSAFSFSMLLVVVCHCCLTPHVYS
jgi:hypothetical protein